MSSARGEYPGDEASGMRGSPGVPLDDKASGMSSARGEYPGDEASRMRGAPGVPGPIGYWAWS